MAGQWVLPTGLRKGGISRIFLAMTDQTDLSGGCHCCAVRFRLKAPARVELLDCNCSICSRTGYLHLIVPHGDFVLERGQDALTSYRFGSQAADHLFCSHCGIKSFYQPRSHPEAWSVNWHCLDEGHDIGSWITAFDGRNWEGAKKSLDARA